MSGTPTVVTPPPETAAALTQIAKLATAAAAPVVVSPPFSFKGWLLTTELKNNARFFKNLLNVAGTTVGIDGVTGGQVPVLSGHVLLILGALALIAVLKVALDAVQYFISRQTVPPSPQQ